MSNREELISIFKNANCIFKKHDISFWLDAGTLLGFIREGDIFEHDKDFDTGSIYESFVCKVPLISKEFYHFGYDVHVSKSKFTIIKGDGRLTVHLYGRRGGLYGKEVIFGKKYKFIGDFINYIIIEGITSPYTSLYHNPKKLLINFFREIVRKIRIKKLYRPLILATTKADIFNYYPIRFPLIFFDNLLEVDFHGEKVNIPKYAELYLTYCYDHWRVKPKQKTAPDAFYVQVLKSARYQI